VARRQREHFLGLSRAKEAAGRAAAELVRDGMTVGLGTGSTVQPMLERLAERVAAERLSLRCVPTSLATERRARSLRLPIASLEEVEAIDLTIDGADEIDGRFDMIKGGGGALLREKVVAALSRREVIVVDRSKVVETLGTRCALPVEVVPFARAAVARRIAAMGAGWKLRMRDGKEALLTDNGNQILDCRFPDGIRDAAALERELDRIPGVVECGLFIGLAHALLVGHDDGRVELRERSGAGRAGG
jgi:ribose 5-phosphate isomerase A